MAVEIKTHRDHPSSMAERIEKRTRPSNDIKNADVVKQVGHSPNRTITSIHHSRVTDYGKRAPEEPGISGEKRGVV